MIGTVTILSMATGLLPMAPATAPDRARLSDARFLISSSAVPSLQDSGSGAPVSELNAEKVFADVVTRYRSLSRYEDRVRIEHVTTREGEEPRKHETQLHCTYDEAGSFSVTTPGDQVRESIGLGGVIRRSPLLQDVDRQYGLWLAPHLTLRISKDPLRELRAGVPEVFTPVRADRVVENDQELVRVELRSGSESSESPSATFEVFIHPDSLLIVKMNSRQQMPDGVLHETRMEITPLRYETAAGAA